MDKICIKYINMSPKLKLFLRSHFFLYLFASDASHCLQANSSLTIDFINYKKSIVYHLEMYIYTHTYTHIWNHCNPTNDSIPIQRAIMLWYLYYLQMTSYPYHSSKSTITIANFWASRHDFCCVTKIQLFFSHPKLILKTPPPSCLSPSYSIITDSMFC